MMICNARKLSRNNVGFKVSCSFNKIKQQATAARLLSKNVVKKDPFVFFSFVPLTGRPTTSRTCFDAQLDFVRRRYCMFGRIVEELCASKDGVIPPLIELFKICSTRVTMFHLDQVYWYRQGTSDVGDDEQRFQLRLKRIDVIREGMRDLKRIAKEVAKYEIARQIMNSMFRAVPRVKEMSRSSKPM